MDKLTERQYINIGLVLVSVVLVLNAYAYIHTAAHPYVRADVWRHLFHIVLPFLDGDKGFYSALEKSASISTFARA